MTWVPVAMLILGLLVLAALGAMGYILWLLNRTEVKIGPKV